MNASLDLVLAGNLLVDDIVHADGRTVMGEPGGAVFYAALGAALWGCRVGVVSVAGDDYPSAALAALETRGVDLVGVRPLGRPGVRTWLLYEPAGRRVIHRLGRPSHADVSPRPEDIPATFENPSVFHVAPAPLPSQEALVESLAGQTATRISLDPHEPVREDNLTTWRRVLESVDAFFPSEDELQLDRADTDLRSLLERLMAGRLEIVAFKRGPRGGVLLDRSDGSCVEWSEVPLPAVDPTGAGDAFAGGFLSAWAQGRSRDEAIERGVVAASFAVEAWGPRGLLAATPDAAERRRHSFISAKGRT